MKWMKRVLLTLAVLVAVVLLAGVAIYLTNRDIINSPRLSATSEELSLTASLGTASGWSDDELREALAWADDAGATAVVVLDDGQVVAEWGDTSLVSDVHSVRKSFADLCDRHGVSQSVGRTGVCWDNATAESFLATLKKELVHRRVFKTRAEARLAIRHWIEAWYNRRRLHSRLGYQSPIDWEDHYRHTTNTLAA